MMVLNGLWAGLAIVGGAVVVLLLGEPSDGMMALVLGLAAGVMLAVTALELLPAAVVLSGYGRMLVGVALGGMMLWCVSRALAYLPDLAYGVGSLGYLVFVGVALHDVLEGLAVAVGYGVAPSLGLALVLAVGVHHVPEGMAMAAPLMAAGVPRLRIIFLAGLTALATPLGTLLGLTVQTMSDGVLGMLLAMAAGMMTMLALGELWQEGKAYHPANATIGVMVGVIAMWLIYRAT